MKRLSLLKTIVSIFFVVCMVALFFGLPLIIIAAFFPGKIPSHIKVNSFPLTAFHMPEILLMLANYVAAIFYVYALYLFKKVLGLFEKKKIFSDEVLKMFNQMGRFIVVGCIIGYISSFLYNILALGKIEIGITTSWTSALFIMGLGLFFIVLGDVFATAKQLKEENDLTV